MTLQGEIGFFILSLEIFLIPVGLYAVFIGERIVLFPLTTLGVSIIMNGYLFLALNMALALFGFYLIRKGDIA